MAESVRTQVGIVGAGPAGLLLAHLLHLEGIESVVLEVRDREYVEKRVRAGLLEQGTVDLLTETGVGERLHREALAHHGINLQFSGTRHYVPMTELTGRSIFIYGQQEVVKDLIATRLGYGAPLEFEVSDVAVHDFDGERPRITYADAGGSEVELACDFIAGCDGFHGVCRPAIPEGVLTCHDREYPFAWLGILAEVAPSTDELIYCRHDHGFALHSMRSPSLSRLYLQVPVDEDIEDWSDERIWAEMQTRFALEGWTLEEGPVLEKLLAPVRSFVAEPMQCGRLFLAGDAAHIVPPTGAKGLNLAAHDVRVLADAMAAFYADGSRERLDAYSETVLRRVWRAQDFSYYMTTLLHRLSDDSFDAGLQLARLHYVTHSEAAARSLAENYVGLTEI
jgi:p-hydroxybenzoate 3-monooxygenase